MSPSVGDWLLLLPRLPRPRLLWPQPSTASLSVVHIFARHPREVFQVGFMGQKADASLTAQCPQFSSLARPPCVLTSSAVRVCQMPL